MKIHIRPLNPQEAPVLEEFLYQAIFVPAGRQPPPREILQEPELRVYVEGFGTRPDDYALAAEADGKIVGAVWARIMDDYGHVDGETPSLAISLLPECRGQGAGTALMKAMLTLLREHGYRQASLAVQKANYAVKLYRNVGFRTVDENAQEYIMVNRLLEK